MRLHLTRDIDEFAGRVQAFLGGKLEHNILATVLINARDGAYGESLFAYGLGERGEVVHAALRTPPWPMLSSAIDPAGASELMALWHEHDPDLPGISAEPATARALGAAWEGITGGAARLKMGMAMHALSEVVDPPRPAGGVLRPPAADERALLTEWMREFIAEAGAGSPSEARRAVDLRLAHDGLLVWDDGGRPVSFLGVTPPVNRIVRIGPVYTPPEHRRRGYGGTAVAAASRRALAGDADRCMLFTDLTNSTSNKIYAEVGYRRIGAWEELSFTPEPLRGERR